MKYNIAQATITELPMLASIETAAGRLFPSEDLPGDLQFMAISLTQFEEAQDRNLLWVVRDEGALPIAFLIATNVDRHFHILEFDVHPDHGRKGVGSKLLSYVLGVAKARQYAAATLTTFAHLPWNAPFYAKRGFSILTADEIGPELIAIVNHEARIGLRNRVAMRLDLDAIEVEPRSEAAPLTFSA